MCRNKRGIKADSAMVQEIQVASMSGIGRNETNVVRIEKVRSELNQTLDYVMQCQKLISDDPLQVLDTAGLVTRDDLVQLLKAKGGEATIDFSLSDAVKKLKGQLNGIKSDVQVLKERGIGDVSRGKTLQSDKGLIKESIKLLQYCKKGEYRKVWQYTADKSLQFNEVFSQFESTKLYVASVLFKPWAKTLITNILSKKQEDLSKELIIVSQALTEEQGSDIDIQVEGGDYVFESSAPPPSYPGIDVTGDVCSVDDDPQNSKTIESRLDYQ